MRKLWPVLFGAPLLAIVMASIQVYYLMSIWTYDGQEKFFEITPGESFARINHRLYKSNIISSSKIFYRYSKYQGLITKFKSGKFKIRPSSNMTDVIDTLLHGPTLNEKITIPEGKNIFEIGRILEKNQITTYKKFVRLAKNPRFAREMGVQANRLEGYLYPDTYQFAPKTPPKTIIRTMVKTFRNKTRDVDFSRSRLSAHDVIILASIVEKETGAAHERAMIAGIYHNRLRKRMRLYSDPTTIYGVYETFNGNLTKKHLQQKTEYNTYRMGGLPTGPISNPGIASIKAAVNPAKHNYLYFVSKNDGTHEFTTNYRDHLKAVKIWQKTRSNRKGKSWRDLNK